MCGRRSGLFLAAVIALTFGAGLMHAGAEFRLDATLCFPFQGTVSPPPVIPIVQVGAQYSAGSFRAGVGLDALVLIVENAFWPGVFVEFELWRFVLRADLGGGEVVLIWGEESHSYTTTGQAIIPQVDLAFKLTNSVQLSVGALAFQALGGGLGSFAVGYVGVRLILFGAGGSRVQ
jgi:hypothetical protein